MANHDSELARALDSQLARLVDEFREAFSREVVSDRFRETLSTMQDARVKTFLPILTYRLTRERLRREQRAGHT